jgi:hypothetical protein
LVLGESFFFIAGSSIRGFQAPPDSGIVRKLLTRTGRFLRVIPAKAGIQISFPEGFRTPAFAGMTANGLSHVQLPERATTVDYALWQPQNTAAGGLDAQEPVKRSCWSIDRLHRQSNEPGSGWWIIAHGGYPGDFQQASGSH